MNKFTENYSKVLEGYEKTKKCIESVDSILHIPYSQKMFECWVNLLDYYCDQVYHDKENCHRKRDADTLGEAAAHMFESLKNTFEQKLHEFAEPEYEGSFAATRIKSLQEYAEH